MARCQYHAKYRQIGRRIAFYRKLRDLSQDDLAAKIGISKSYLSKIEAANSDISFSLDVLFAIAEGVELDVVVFFLPINENLAHG
ncbi:helix-turn-helix domain-containing protein [Propionispora vibrioides]|uniref:Helix-turn-helix domain-containing protein n=1 Tax=Propionispora vibrioides TaxID=112903 RepID=A0A1H8Y4E5_9FIRM|nr:helix-turn-helix transcriptional regulator [Propionispora vibrioides]SEP46942.1 Helix-turn-helix domain-containing protein [Propionispora vibrioides]